VDALILAGGLGTRLASVVSDRAKPVALVDGEPFVLHVLRHLARARGSRKIRRAILCVGHRSESVRAALGDRAEGIEIAYSVEARPLGTGGALRLAIAAQGVSSPAIALNGDTFFAASIEKLLAHQAMGRFDATMALAHVADASRYGTVGVEDGRAVAFEEKGRGGPNWINGGIYALGKRALDRIANGPEAFSLERDVLPDWAAAGRLGAWRSRARFIDIGIPADYARAAAFVGKSRG
jgi:D-glycero-alpha-D-manno-heptose 1-phosphate guanylyltransferase